MQILNPETVCLTGPLGRHHSYATVFHQGLIELGFSAKITLATEAEIVTPSMASAYLALSNLVYSPNFSFDQEPDAIFNEKVVSF